MDTWQPPSLLCAALALLTACGLDPAPAPGAGSGGQAAAATGGSTATGGDEGDDCATALELEPLTNVLGGTYYEHHGVLDPAGDRDSYRFTAQAGQWFAMNTNHEGGANELDTVLTLRDEAGSVQLARSDDASPPGRRDSEIIHRFAADGSYCLQVSEHAELVGNPPVGDPSFRYRLRVFPVDFERYDDWNLDDEPNDDLTAPQELSVVPFNTAPFTRIVGQLGAQDDVDVCRVVPGATAERVAVVFTPSGSEFGNGSASGPGLVRLRYDDAEAGILAELDYQSRPPAGYLIDAPERLPFGIMATADPGQGLLLEVAAPAGGASPGPHDFYAFVIETGWTAVQDHEPNDVRADAAVQSLVSNTPGVKIHPFDGLLPAGDVDWGQTNRIDTGTTIELFCASWQLGSSLRDATFALFFGDETQPVQEQTETEHTAVRWSNDPAMQPTMPAVTVPPVEFLTEYYLRVTATQYDPTIESVYWSCRVVVREP